MSEITAADLEYVNSPEYLRLRLDGTESLLDMVEPVLLMSRLFFDQIPNSPALDAYRQSSDTTLKTLDEWHDTRGR